ncbi:Enolase-phosphatase E1 [Balamuthia mandrillaris]
MEATPKPQIKALVLDIEGTLTPISFVADKLFPYIRKELEGYLDEHWEEESLQVDVEGLRKLALADREEGGREDVVLIPTAAEEPNKDAIKSAVVKNVIAQMDIDRKTTALKALQGHMWQHGYASGELKGELFLDVAPALYQFRGEGIPIYIYSSGSVEAQKLLLKYSTEGDMLPLFAGHFDTKIGSKLEAQSYRNIAAEIGLQGEGREQHILFITDNILEAQAASSVSWQVLLTKRPGNKELPAQHPFHVVTSLEYLWKEEKNKKEEEKKENENQCSLFPFQLPPLKHPRCGVAVCIVHSVEGEEKVLVGLRKGSHGAGQWAFPGGALEYGEELEACARREVLEETGLHIKNIRFSTILNDTDYGLHFVCPVMQAEVDGDATPLVMEPQKCERWEWVSWDNLPTPCFSGLRMLKAQSWSPFSSSASSSS